MLKNLPDLNPALNPEATKWGKQVAEAIRELAGEQSTQRSEVRQAKRAATGAAQIADSASATAATTLSALRAIPAAPQNVQVTASSATFAPNGLPIAVITLSWDAVTLDDAGVELPSDSFVGAYEVWENINTAPHMLGVVTVTGEDSPSIELQLDAGRTYTLYVRGRTANVNGVFSEPLVHVAPTPTAPGLQPTAPTLSSELGVVAATWDGMLIDGSPVEKPNWIDYIYAETAPDSTGPWTRTGQTLRGEGAILVSGAPVGDTIWVRFKSVTTAGTESAASAADSVLVTGVDLGTLEADVADAIQQAQDAADAAQTSADGKNSITRSDLPASGAGEAVGDLWFQYLGGAVIGMWIWDGAAWASQDIDGVVLANIDAGTITVGFLAGERIEVASVGADQIAVGSLTGDRIAAGSITANEIAFATLTGNEIAAGTITVSHLDAGVGGALDLSANSSISFLVGRADSIEGQVGDVSDNLENMQTYYQFGVDGAIISSPDSPFAVAIRNDRIEMMESGVPLSYWNAGQMYVDSLVVNEVELGNHKLEKYGTATVIRAL